MDDWTHHFIDAPDNTIPFTQYLARGESGSEYDFLVLDTSSPEIIERFSSQNNSLVEILYALPSNCINRIGRFEVYSLKCQENNRHLP